MAWKSASGALPTFSSLVANKVYIDRWQGVIAHSHKCNAVRAKAVPVRGVFRREPVSRGDLELFNLTGHPNAKPGCAWSRLDAAKDERSRFGARLEMPPVVSAASVVRLQIVNDAKQPRKMAIAADVKDAKGKE